MNFEFKSTFIQYFNNVKATPATYYMRSLLLNIASILVIAGLYLSNNLLPAAIISRSHGMLCFGLAILAIIIKLIASLAHVTALLIKYQKSIRHIVAITAFRLNARIRPNQPYVYASSPRSSIKQTHEL